MNGERRSTSGICSLLGEFNNGILGCLRFVEIGNGVAQAINVPAKHLEILAGAHEVCVVALVLIEAHRQFDSVDLLEDLRDRAPDLVRRCPPYCRLRHDRDVGTKEVHFKALPVSREVVELPINGRTPARRVAIPMNVGGLRRIEAWGRRCARRERLGSNFLVDARWFSIGDPLERLVNLLAEAGQILQLTLDVLEFTMDREVQLVDLHIELGEIGCPVLAQVGEVFLRRYVVADELGEFF
jgi:hypothetical protein